MAFDIHSLEAASTVLTAPSPATSGTTLVLQSGDGAKFSFPQNATVFPAGAQPTLANSEIVRITGISTDTLTITRAQEGSSARSIVIGDQIANTITPKVLTDIEGRMPSGTVVGTTDTQTLTNKSINGSSNTLTNIPTESLYNAVKFSVVLAVSVNSANNAFGVVPYDTKLYDTGSNVDVVTNKGRFTAPVAGFYHFDACATASASSTNTIIALYKNGSLLQRGPRITIPTTNPSIWMSLDVQLSASDYIEVWVLFSAAIALDINDTYFSGRLTSLT